MHCLSEKLISKILFSAKLHSSGIDFPYSSYDYKFGKCIEMTTFLSARFGVVVSTIVRKSSFQMWWKQIQNLDSDSQLLKESDKRILFS